MTETPIDTTVFAVRRNRTTKKRSGPKTRILPLWIEIWLGSSSIICFLDVMFTMLRPYSTNGILATFFYIWNVYASVDARYADANDLVTCATGRIMLIEIALNLITLTMSRRQSRHALLTAFTTSAFVFWKTLWFLTLYIMPPPGNMSYFADETTYLRLVLIFWIPNGFWVAVPFTVMVALWNKLALPVDRIQDYETIDKI
ncbi:unnamed protein product [Angiostrongylus costaricensis]|uniref:Transmembrane protein n=1 Tax=Angiostrongylus costaricensis TaxID=334426 RepID=A0A0R3PL48_ANGCS|nr:unnamed protein product [Angiostrongylus costaricensis]